MKLDPGSALKKYFRAVFAFFMGNAYLKCFSLYSAGSLFFHNIFNDSVFAGKHIISDTKHYRKNGSLFIYVVKFGAYVNQYQITYVLHNS